MDKLARNAFNWKALISNLVLGFASHDSDSRDIRSLQGSNPLVYACVTGERRQQSRSALNGTTELSAIHFP
jgi:hypothetical protein